MSPNPFTPTIAEQATVARLQQLPAEEQDELFQSFVSAQLISERSGHFEAAAQAQRQQMVLKRICGMAEARCIAIVLRTQGSIEAISAALDAYLTVPRTA